MNKYNKFIIFFIIVLFSITGTCFSQVILLGIKAGAGFSNLVLHKNWKTLSGGGNDGRLINFNGGLTVNLKIADDWSLHSEILFEDKGYKSIYYYIDSLYQNHQNPRNVTEKHIAHNYYLHFPQTIRYQIPFGKRKRYSIYLEAGGYFAYYFGTKSIEIQIVDGIQQKSTGYMDITKLPAGTNCHKFDWGATAGTGILIPLWQGQFDINIKYDHMLQPWDTNPVTDVKYYYNVLAITIGYAIPVMNRKY